MHQGVEAAAVEFRFVLAFVFLAASVPKLVASDDFREAVSRYRLLPATAATKVAYWLPRLELACATALFAGLLTPVASFGAAGLLVLFSASIAVNLMRGRKIDCGCQASSAPRRITWTLVVVDTVMAGTALFVAFEVPRTLALDVLWLGRSGTVSGLDGLALLVTASLAVVGQLLVRETWRVRVASTSALV